MPVSYRNSVNRLFGVYGRALTSFIYSTCRHSVLPCYHSLQSLCGAIAMGSQREVNPESWTQLKGSNET